MGGAHLPRRNLFSLIVVAIIGTIIVAAILNSRQAPVSADGASLATIPRSTPAYRSGFWITGTINSVQIPMRVDPTLRVTTVAPEVVQMVGMQCTDAVNGCRLEFGTFKFGPFLRPRQSVLVSRRALDGVTIGADILRDFEVLIKNDVMYVGLPVP